MFYRLSHEFYRVLPGPPGDKDTNASSSAAPATYGSPSEAERATLPRPPRGDGLPYGNFRKLGGTLFWCPDKKDPGY